MEKLFIEDLPIKGKKVLMRVDFNVPLDLEGNVTDSKRILAALPSIQYILNQGGALILMSHLGRPHNVRDPELSLAPVVKLLSALLGQGVLFAPDCIGEEAETLVQNLQPGQVLMLENLRFHRAEEHPEEDPSFAQQLASYADLFVNDAFGAAHRVHSSTCTITAHFPGKAAAGYLLAKEIHFLGEALSHPERPFYGIIGGAKISTKIGVLKSLLKKVDRLLIGGGMAYTFLKAKGFSIGSSLVEEDLVLLAKELLQEHPTQILLPSDCIAAQECTEEAETVVLPFSQSFPEGYQGLSIGPETVKTFCTLLKEAKTILWNGPLGVYEFQKFAAGTNEIAQFIGSLDATTIVGGGDLIAAVGRAGVAKEMTHLSTGGGATLEYIELGTLPAIEALSPSLSPKA